MKPLALALGLAAGVAMIAACGEGHHGAAQPVLAADWRPASPTPDSLADGERLFRAACTACHGELALGTTQGPPLLHPFYEPGHHGDEAFQQAVLRGVRPHHWSFGPMPAVPGLDRPQVARIAAYVRWLQGEAGIGR